MDDSFMISYKDEREDDSFDIGEDSEDSEEYYEDEIEDTFCSLLRYFFFRYILGFIFILLVIAVIRSTDGRL